MVRQFILTAVLFSLACAGKGNDDPESQPRLPAGAAADTIAAEGKTGLYLTRGSFTGGEVTDGRDIHDIGWSVDQGFERIKIRIYEARWEDSGNASPVSVPCRFKVSREDFPARLLVETGGTRMFSAGPPELPADALVTGFYRIVYLDDAGHMLAFDVKDDTEFEVFETHDPAMIIIDIREVPTGSRGGPGKVFSLRSVSWPPGEHQGHFQEELMRTGAEDSRILRDAEGAFCVEEGWYTTLEEAQEKQRLLAEKNIILYIEQRGAGESPGNIPYDKQ